MILYFIGFYLFIGLWVGVAFQHKAFSGVLNQSHLDVMVRIAATIGMMIAWPSAIGYILADLWVVQDIKKSDKKQEGQDEVNRTAY